MAETWQDIRPQTFDQIAQLAAAAGGIIETNTRGAEFLYFGQNELGGKKYPALIAIRHPRLPNGFQKCRANTVAIQGLK